MLAVSALFSFHLWAAVGPNFGLTGNALAPPFVSRSGYSVQVVAAVSAMPRFFPGVGSPVGSILPGVVLTTAIVPANLTFNRSYSVPDLHTIAPTYLADAPFINRLYGESSLELYRWRKNSFHWTKQSVGCWLGCVLPLLS